MDPHAVLHFWFDEVTPRQWFQAGRTLDATVRARFGAALAEAKAGELDGWADTPEGRLALIILLDQFSRHIFRGHAEAFAADAKAQCLARDGIARGLDAALQTPAQRNFFYMPLMHAEDGALQALALEKFIANGPEVLGGGALKAARQHADIIARFGRFPQRNRALGRPSTPAEQVFLNDHPA